MSDFIIKKGVLVNYQGNEETLIIPNGVLAIGDSVFSYRENLEKVLIPGGVTSIGKSAFEGCTNLKEITIPESITSIGAWAFHGCENLRGITIPKGVTSIEANTFTGCDNLRNVRIPEGVTSIGNSAFAECNGLEEIIIPEGVKIIDEWAFAKCENLTKVTIPQSVIEIVGNVFADCKKLKYINEVEIEFFIFNKELKGYMGSNEVVVVPYNVKCIGADAFYGCELKGVVIPEGVTSIGNGAFSYCNNLMSITIPQSVTNISGNIFLNSPNLRYINGVETKFLILNGELKSYIGKTEVVIIPDSVVSIGYEAFFENNILKSVVIPEGVKVDNRAFAYCENLTSVTVPDSAVIDDNAFQGCDKLILTRSSSNSNNVSYYSESNSMFKNIVDPLPNITHDVGIQPVIQPPGNYLQDVENPSNNKKSLLNLTEEQLTNVGRVIFGLQNKHSLLSSSATRIIAGGLVEIAGKHCLNSEQSVIDTITNYLQSLCDSGETGNETIVLLIAGEHSLANLLEIGPKTVHVNKVNNMSSKHSFRICKLGEEPDVESYEDTPGIPTSSYSKPVDDCFHNSTDDYSTRVRKIKDAILPLCPNAVKTEFPDNEYAQALCMAEYYYKNNI